MKEFKYLVLDSLVKVVKTDSKVLPWKAYCKYSTYKVDENGELLKVAIAHGVTKNDAMISAVSMAYREVIKALKESNN